MSLRWKIALALAGLVMVATVAIGAVSYRSTRDRLLAEVDRSLTEVDGVVADGRLGRDALPRRGPLAGLDAQIITIDGTIVESTFPVEIPVTDDDVRVAGVPRASRFATVATDAGDYRIRTIGFPRGAVQVGRSLAETDRVLLGLRGRILVWSALVGGAAVGVGLLIANRITASLRRLTSAAEHVETTGRLDVAVGEHGDDEVGRLGVAFDRMLAALARSKDDQRRLVQDAGHELRTPLTSLRTNLDALVRYPEMSDDDRDAIVADLQAEASELTDLVNEVVAVASGDSSDEPYTAFDLGEVTAEVADRYRRRTGRTIELDATASPVVAQRSAVQRALSCLLDNACKFDRSESPITVTVRDAGVVVADRGPGIAPDDLDRVFDRFHRADDARTLPGSGLGLSIVAEVAARHGGGTTFARPRAGGGAEVGFRLGEVAGDPTADLTGRTGHGIEPG